MLILQQSCRNGNKVRQGSAARVCDAREVCARRRSVKTHPHLARAAVSRVAEATLSQVVISFLVYAVRARFNRLLSLSPSVGRIRGIRADFRNRLRSRVTLLARGLSFSFFSFSPSLPLSLSLSLSFFLSLFLSLSLSLVSLAYSASLFGDTAKSAANHFPARTMQLSAVF